MKLANLIDLDFLVRMQDEGYVRASRHPSEPLCILNYTQACQYDRVWNDVTRQCRGLIFGFDPEEDWHEGWVVARPWPKFHNYGEHDEGTLDLHASVTVADKEDGSLGILYPVQGGFAIATRGSFTSEQALHATEVWNGRHAESFDPWMGVTYLYEIVYPGNRVVLNYGSRDEIILLGAIDVLTGREKPEAAAAWRGPRAEVFYHQTLAEALTAEPRENAEGLVITYTDSGMKVKLKQDDYVALHRIMTGTNARNVWEVAAVRACAHLITDRKHWGSYLGIGPDRAEEALALGDEWLDGVPDEFHGWVRDVTATAEEDVHTFIAEADRLVEKVRELPEGQARWEACREHPAAKEILAVAAGKPDGGRITMRAWRNACPDPTAPFARDEAIA